MTATPASSELDASLRQGLKWSLIVHAVALLAMAIQGYVLPAAPVRIIPSLRVDLVGLPDVLKKDLKNPSGSKSLQEMEKILEKVEAQAEKIHVDKTPPKLELETAQKDEMVLKKNQIKTAPPIKTAKERSKKLKSALNRIKALNRIQSEVADEKNSEAAPLIKGNQLSKGTSLAGDAKESLEENYFDRVRDSLLDNWALPVWIARQKLNAKAQLWIDGRGRLIRFNIVESSGNAQFDAAVRSAIQKSQPFRAPPKAIADSLSVHGILVGFPL